MLRPDQFAEIPNVVRDPGCHRGRDPKAPVNPAEIVMRKEERKRSLKIFPVFAERMREPG